MSSRSIRSKAGCSFMGRTSKATRILRRQLRQVGIDIVSSGGQRTWQVVMRLEQHYGHSDDILHALNQCVREQEEGAADHLKRHVEEVKHWLGPSHSGLQISERRLKRLALVAVFSPAVSLLRACESVYGVQAATAEFPRVAAVCLVRCAATLIDHLFRAPSASTAFECIGDRCRHRIGVTRSAHLFTPAMRICKQFSMSTCTCCGMLLRRTLSRKY